MIIPFLGIFKLVSGIFLLSMAYDFSWLQFVTDSRGGDRLALCCLDILSQIGYRSQMSILLCFIKAWMIGIAIAAPVGPIGMLCIRKTLELGLIGALAVGLGAAIADSIYGVIAVTGLTALSHFLLEKTVAIKIVGGLFLGYLAYKEMKSETSPKIASAKSHSVSRLIVEIFFLTLTNPMTILSFIGIFASIGGGPTGIIESLAMVLGIFLGSMTWWLILGGVILKIKHKLPETWIHRIKYLSAVILAGFGIFAVYSGLQAR